MTREETLKELEKINKDYYASCDNLKREWRRNSQRILNKWAEENGRFKIGDIIELNGYVICVDKITGVEFREELHVDYAGPLLTKQLKPRKDESRFTIYDDNIKDIKLLKRKDNGEDC